MTEIQGPTPAGTSRPYRTLREALRAHRIPEENHEFITAIVDAVGVTALIDRGRYIEAIRRDEGPTLHIGKTYTNGFMAGEQIIVGSAAIHLQSSEGRAPHLYVSHPSEFRPLTPAKATKRAAGTRATMPRAEPALRVAKPIEREYGVCDVCFMTRTAAGTCSCD